MVATPSLLIAAEKALGAAKRAYWADVRTAQRNCGHTRVAEAPAQSMSFFPNSPPLRVCEQCGLAEESNYGSYKVLTTLYVRAASRDELYRISRIVPDDLRA